MERRVASLTGELVAAYEELALLHTLAAKIGRLGEEDSIAAAALREAMEVLHADCGWVVVWDADRARVPEGCCLGVAGETAGSIAGRVLEPQHFRRKNQVLSHELRYEHGVSEADAPERLLASSLPVGGISLGYICVGRPAAGRIFTSADQKLLSAVASFTAVALDNVRLRRAELEKQRLEGELDLARGVQQHLLPRDFLCVDFLEAEGVSLPCQQIGGDYFDLLPIGRDQCLLAMADVSGKGPAAALQAAMLQGVVHAYSRNGMDLPPLMHTINKCIRERRVDGAYATAVVALLDRSGQLVYSNGGHNPPLWIERHGRVRELTEGGPLLGFLEEAVWRQGSIKMAPGDLVVFYTDGVTEAENEQGEEFGALQLVDWAGRHAGCPPREARESLVHAVTRFCGGRRQADDLAVMVVQYRGPG